MKILTCLCFCLVTGSLPESWAVMFHMVLNISSYFYCVAGWWGWRVAHATKMHRIPTIWAFWERFDSCLLHFGWTVSPHPRPPEVIRAAWYTTFGTYTHEMNVGSCRKHVWVVKLSKNIPLDIICADLCIFVWYNLPCIRAQYLGVSFGKLCTLLDMNWMFLSFIDDQVPANLMTSPSASAVQC